MVAHASRAQWIFACVVLILLAILFLLNIFSLMGLALSSWVRHGWQKGGKHKAIDHVLISVVIWNIVIASVVGVSQIILFFNVEWSQLLSNNWVLYSITGGVSLGICGILSAIQIHKVIKKQPSKWYVIHIILLIGGSILLGFGTFLWIFAIAMTKWE